MRTPRTKPLAVLLALAAVAALALPVAASADASPSPWWQLLSGARPTVLPIAPDQSETQEVSAAKFKGEVLVARVEVGGETIGCLGSGELSLGVFHFPAAELCESEVGFPVTETPAQLAQMLEAGPYGPDVQVSGGPAGSAPFQVTTTDRWVTDPIVVTPIAFKFGPNAFVLGSASSKVISEGSGRLVLTLTNLGDAPVNGTSETVTIEDRLPKAGISAYGVEAVAGGQGSAGPVPCTLLSVTEVSCSFEGELPSFEAIEVEVLVALSSAAAGEEAGTVSVSGGETPAASVPQPLRVGDEAVPFGLESFSVDAEEAGGGPTSQAGAHPFQLTTTIVANSGPMEGARADTHSVHVAQPALPRNLRFTWPAGLIGNATAAPTCPLAVFLTSEEAINECPDESAVGVASVTLIESNALGLVRLSVPVFSLPPERGEPARLGLMIAATPVLIDTSVDPGDGYRIHAEVRNVSQVIQFLASTTTIWGDPGSPAHDSARGWNCTYFGKNAPGECEPPATRHEVPFLRMPVSCAGQLGYDIAFEPWNVPIASIVARAFDTDPAPVGCNQVPFDPEISNALTSRLAANPSGLDFHLEMPSSGLLNPAEGAISEAQFKKAEVTLPEGVTINPSQAEGLAVCSEADYARERYDSKPGEGCPEASKIGSVQISTPLLEEKAEGSLYVATPYENPTGSMIALYLVAKIPERGVLVKQAGKVEPDPRSGRLVSTFDHVPQLPVSSFALHFREGARSPLITPPGCGTFTTTARFVPWSANDPEHPAPGEVVTRTASFTIDRGVGGGACPFGSAPFHPGFEAGTLNNQAGSYSPFAMRLTRGDGEQDMGRFSFVLPPGVVPKLAGIPYCPEAAIAQAASRQGPHGGEEEKNSPSCPAASQIGRTVAGAGVGNQLTYVPGKLYLAGPYHGDPLSAVSITPAVAGPFDAGTVVVREALRLNPVTHVGEVDGAASDPIPHILKGIPLNLRDLRVYADRPEFTLNATSCEPFAASSTIWGDGTALEPRAPTPVALSSRYQAAGCASLGFKPKLALKLKGGTKRGSHPALKAVVTPRAGDANFAGAVVTLPHSAFLDQAHIRTICTRVQFAAGAGNGAECPPGAQYGYARAWTPLLDQPLEGPVFLRSSDHNLPDLVLALHGLIDIDLASRIDSVHGGIRSSFEDVPDAPVSRFVLEMQGAKKGLIVNSTDLCQGTHRAKAVLSGQNGRVDSTKPLVRALGCGKGKRKSHRYHKRGSHR